MGREPGRGNGRGAEPGPVPGLPSADDALRDDRLAGFAKDGEWDTCPPSAALAAVLEAASGNEWRCPGATRDEMFGLLRQWAALESWAVAAKLGILRALIREEDQPLPGGDHHGDLPDGWTKSLTHEVALALVMPPQSAEKLMWTAWDLHALRPGIGALLADGTLTYAKARAVDDALAVLADEDAAKAEAMIVPHLAGKTYGQTEKLALQAAITVDPGSATRRREDAERNQARVALRRDPSGAASLAGYDLPADETLAAHANVCARASCYQDSGVFAGVRMDQFRALAYLDILNGIPAAARIARGQPPAGLGATNTDGPDGPDGNAAGSGGAADPGGHISDAGPDREDPEDPGPSGGPGGIHPGGGPQSDGSPSDGASPPPRLADLVLPLSTLLGLADRPGEGHGLGPLDPDLCRALAAAAANSRHSTLCVTVTDPGGIAIGHGCARRNKPQADPAHGPPRALAALPARVNLTITAARLAGLARTTGPPGRVPWAFTRIADPGPPGGYGTWELALPDGRQLTVRLESVPTSECDHRHESHAYKPNATLRHLVQVRDQECTFPTCSRHATESDFEHALPYDKGGRTCGCNAGARSRRCHQVKQSKGWNVTQPRPGWHRWQTPSGRVYAQGPKRYPV
jgi:hypothetical protein